MALQDTLRALSDESRLRIAVILSAGTFTGQELTYVLDVSQPTVSHHLKVLQSAGIVQAKKEAQWCFYSLSPKATFAREVVAQALSEHTPQIERDKRRTAEIIDRRKDRSRDYFNAVARRWRSLRDQIHGVAVPIDELVRRIPEEAAVLELGCGSGILLEALQHRVGKTIGVDSSEAMLEEACRNAPRADLRLGYLEHLPIGDESIDVAVASLVFHHLPERSGALQDIARVLTKGGRLLILDRTDEESEKLRQQFQDLWFGFTTDELIDELNSVGLRREELTTLGDGTYFLLSAVKE